MAMTLEQQRAEAEAEASRLAAEAAQPAPQQGPPTSAMQPPQQPSYASDMLKSAGSGIRQGLEGLGGMMGDSSQMSGDVASWLAQKFGASPETAGTIGSVAKRINPWGGMMPTTQEVQGVTDAVAGPAYQPQTIPGDYARTIGQFAPSALAGPGGMVRKAAMAVIPGLASETAGQLTEGTAAEPYARGLGALAGGVASAGKNANAVKQVLPEARSADDLAAASRALYQQADQAGVMIKAPAFDRVRQNITAAAGRVNKDLRPNTAGIVEDVAAMAGKDVSLQELDELRQVVGQAMKRAQPQDVRTLERIKGQLDGFADNVQPGDITGDIKGFESIKEARKLWSMKAKTDTLDQIVEKAKNQATGYENGLVIGMRQLANNKSQMKAFTPQEQSMIKDVVRRGSAHGVMRAIGMMAPNSTFGGLAGLGIAGTTGIIPGVVSSAAGAAAKYGAGVMTKNKVAGLQRAVSTGVAPQTGPAPFNLDALIRTLLAAKSGDNSAQANTAIGQPNR